MSIQLLGRLAHTAASYFPKTFARPPFVVTGAFTSRWIDLLARPRLEPKG